MNMLTGGTRDVKPELLSFSVVQSGADATTTQQQPLPILRNFSSGNGSRAQVIEVLKVWADTPPALGNQSSSLFLSSKNFAAVNTTFSEPTVFAGFKKIGTTVTAVGVLSDQDQVQVFDLTDSNGNGILIATDNIFAQYQSVASGVTNTARIKILYRTYGASVLEYVGIVQGQQ
jgi:hypothetical protein